MPHAFGRSGRAGRIRGEQSYVNSSQFHGEGLSVRAAGLTACHGPRLHFGQKWCHGPRDGYARYGRTADQPSSVAEFAR